MQYLLSEEEYQGLLTQIKDAREEAKETIMDLCTQVCDNLPIFWDWPNDDKDDLKPWGCIKTKDYEWYCDTCPVRDICPEPCKHWSK